MKVKYNRISTLGQSGLRFTADTDKYDLVLMDKVSGSIGFRDRPKGKELVKLVDEGKVKELVVEEFSRLGRNTGDVIRTLEWLEEKEVNVIVKNLGLQSRPYQQKNPVWKLLSSMLSSIYEMELENIKERTMVGRQVYVQNGGILGRPSGSNESEMSFLQKEVNINTIKLLKKGLTIRETSKVLGISTRTVMKVKKTAIKNHMI